MLTLFSQMLHGNLNFLFRLLFFSVDDLNFVTALLIISERSIDRVGLFSLSMVSESFEVSIDRDFECIGGILSYSSIRYKMEKQVELPISASLGVGSTVSTCVCACLLLTSKKYKKKLLKCYELLDKITSSLATFKVLISLSIDDGTVIDAKEFHKLQTLYLQLMTNIRYIDRKMKVQTEENFQKTIMDEITNLKKALEQK